MEQVILKTVVNLLPEPVHVNIDHIGERIIMPLPDTFRDSLARQDLSGMKHELLEQGVLFSRQRNGSAAPNRRVIECIQRQILDVEFIPADLSSAPEESPHARQKN